MGAQVFIANGWADDGRSWSTYSNFATNLMSPSNIPGITEHIRFAAFR
jgi:hypothetical protein